MKDFKIGQKVYTLDRDYVQLQEGVIVKMFEKSLRWKVRYDYSNITNIDKHISERFRDNHNVFASFDEAYREAMSIFDKKIEKIEEDRKRFRAETQSYFAEFVS